MKVIFLHNVPGVAERDDVREVAEGYARNFLFPRNLAERADAARLKNLEERKVRHEREREAELKEAQALAQKMEGAEIHIQAKASEEGTLFGSVSPAMISSELAKRGYAEIKKSSVILPEPTKRIGEYEAKIALEHGIEANIRVIIEPEED